MAIELQLSGLFTLEKCLFLAIEARSCAKESAFQP